MVDLRVQYAFAGNVTADELHRRQDRSLEFHAIGQNDS